MDRALTLSRIANGKASFKGAVPACFSLRPIALFKIKFEFSVKTKGIIIIRSTDNHQKGTNCPRVGCVNKATWISMLFAN